METFNFVQGQIKFSALVPVSLFMRKNGACYRNWGRNNSVKTQCYIKPSE